MSETQNCISVMDWNEIDSRPIPTWFDQSKFGIFIGTGFTKPKGKKKLH